MDPNRRKLLKAALLGAGGLGLRGLAAALPAGLLAAPRRAAAATCSADALAGAPGPQRVIFITSDSGDPVNANVPGSYTHGDIYHPPGLETGRVTLGGVEYECALPWQGLASDVGDRICFFHHATYSNAHGDHAKVNALMGAIRRQELLVSFLARNLDGCAPPTIQTAPVVLSDVLIRCSGAVLPKLNRAGLASVLDTPDAGTPDARLRARRDADLLRMNAVFRERATPAQRLALDGYEAAQRQARSQIDPALVDLLNANVPGETEQARLNTAAAVLLKMNITPAVVMKYDFGGDNHRDNQLNDERTRLAASVADLRDLYAKLVTHGLQDSVTIVLMNVFGRTLNAANRAGNLNGRDHNAAHHCTVIIGRGFRGSVIGGVTPTPSGNEFRAADIDSTTGRPAAAGDVPYEATLASVGKTIAAGVGLHRDVIEDPNLGQITAGRVIAPALA